MGTYVKTVDPPDPFSDESGGGHWYHNLNIPRTGTWVHVVLNMHPDHLRGASGGFEHGNQPHPTGEPQYNYFDALTRFYIQDNASPPALPADFLLDEIVFCQETRAENDEQVRNIASTFVAADNRVIVTWFRDKDENEIAHEVRYAFTDIHDAGWDAAAPAPDGIVTPTGFQGYNGMHYDTTSIDVGAQDTLYLAIRPQGAATFTQVIVPLAGPTSNLPPVLGSVSASPHPALVGEPVTFHAEASDADEDAVAFEWSFGDGGFASGADVVHAYSAPGVYDATVTASDAHGAHSQRPVRVVASEGPPSPIVVGAVRAKVRFDRSSGDTLAASFASGAEALPPSWDGLAVHADIGGAARELVLDARGRAKSGDARLRAKRAADGSVQWKLVIRRGLLATAWQDEGVVDADVRGADVSLPLLLVAGSHVLSGEAELVYDGRAGIDGRLR